MGIIGALLEYRKARKEQKELLSRMTPEQQKKYWQDMAEFERANRGTISFEEMRERALRDARKK